MSKVPVKGIPSFLRPSTNLKFYRHENWYIIRLYNIRYNVLLGSLGRGNLLKHDILYNLLKIVILEVVNFRKGKLSCATSQITHKIALQFLTSLSEGPCLVLKSLSKTVAQF